MADATNPNDPTYSNNPNYVWSGGRWQYRSDPSTDPSRDPSSSMYNSTPGLSSTDADGTVHGYMSDGTPTKWNPQTGQWETEGHINAGTTGGMFGGTGTESSAYDPSLGQWWQNFFATDKSGPSAVGYDTTNSEQARGWQQQLVQDLYKQASGSLDTRAQQSLAQNTQNAAAQQQALGSSIRGAGGGAGLRAGSMGAGNVERGLAGQQQMLKTQEQQQAQSALAALYAQMRGMDQSQAQAGANVALQNQSLLNDWLYGREQQSAQGGMQNEQQQAEAIRALLGIQQNYTDWANQMAAKGIQAGATLFGTLSQSGGSGSEAGDSPYGPGYAQSSIDDAFNGG